MNYLAFDIEAANGYNPASICSIGIVIADENFNILRKENLWINPKSKYNLNGTRPNVGIDLNLDPHLLEISPDFAGRYEEIKSLLLASETVVIGHAVDSDVRMINAACQKYKLPCINFKFACTQLIYKCYKNDSHVLGLDKIADELGIKFHQHYSDEDAYMSLMTLKFLCKTTKLDLWGLMKKYNLRWGENVDFEITRPVSLDGQISKRKVTQVAVEKIKKKINQLNKQKHSGDALKGKLCSLSRDLEIADESKWLPVVQKIVAQGGEYTAKVSKCDIYIHGETIGDSSIMREKYLTRRIDNGAKVDVVDIKDFLSKNYGG